ncbi:MAG: DUF72 domain-containing protein [Polyangiaceae bacterium]
MDFGRLPSLAGVSFDLPPLPERSRRMLAFHSGARDPDSAALWLRTGAPAWARKDWLGKMYPLGTPDREFLRLYARRVDSIELNASYYRVPSEEVLDGWASEVPDRFRFCPKVHQSITHRRALEESARDGFDFAVRMLRLGRLLGPGFLQLPPWLDAGGLRGLDELLAALPEAFRVAVEFRHPSWFHRGALREDAVRVLEQRGAGAVITDVAGRRDVCHAAITAPFVIVRFVGNGYADRGLHPTDLPRADVWLRRLVEWRALGLGEAYFFAHEPDDALAPELLTHVAQTARAEGLDVPAIDLAAAAIDLAAPPAGQGTPHHESPPAAASTAQLDLFGAAPAAAAKGPRRAANRTKK